MHMYIMLQKTTCRQLNKSSPREKALDREVSMSPYRDQARAFVHVSF